MASYHHHALILSFPQQGHINPLMQISKCLVTHGFLITFVVSHEDHSRIMQAKETLPNNPKSHTHYSDIRLVGVPDGLPVEHPENVHPYDKMFREHFLVMLNMRLGVEQLIERLQKEEYPLTVILTDIFVTWAHELAYKFGIPMTGFFTSNAMACSIFYHSRFLKSLAILPFKDEDGKFIATDMVTCIPGIPPLHPRDFPLCLTFPESHFRLQFILSQFDNFCKASGILMNTSEELEVESVAIAALRKEVTIFPVGPLLLLSGDDATQAKVDSSYWPEQKDCLEWLDTRPASSVLYVSFGSVASVPVTQIKELALGLEDSQQSFLWVVRSDNVVGSLSDVLPEGFLARTKYRGLIISWAPQLSVLAHPAVGAFLSHCGWNSFMENLSTGGLPMLCWPLVAEQRLNCRNFVDHWKIGMEFQKGGEDEIVNKEEVARVVKAMMEGEEGRQMRKIAAEFRDQARQAAGKGGSSQRNMATFVETLKL